MSAFVLRFGTALVLTSIFLGVTPAGSATFTVTTTSDNGPSSLRQAILDANANPGQDIIDFSGVIAATPVTISLLSGLPPITDSVIMDASIPETRVLPGNPDKRPGIEIDLSGAAPVFGAFGIPFYPTGIAVAGPNASGTVIRGFVVNGIERFLPQLCAVPFFNPDPANTDIPRLEFCSIAIGVFAADAVHIAGNYLNMDSDGAALKGRGVVGISLIDTSFSVIGGTSANDRNVMTAKDFESGDANGGYTMITPQSLGWGEPAFGRPKRFNNNQIIGNYLGLTASGVALNPRARGIWLRSLNTPDDPNFGPRGWGEQCNNTVTRQCEMKDNEIRGNTVTNRGGQSTFAFTGGQENTVLRFNTTFNTASFFDFTGKIEVFENHFTGHPVDMLISTNRFGVDANGIPSTAPSSFGLTVRRGERIRIENNIIAGGFWDGVGIRDVSSFGVEPAVNVTLSQNSIFGNCISGDPLCQGIDLTDPFLAGGPTPNDFLDPDIGANHLQNKPVLLEIKTKGGKGADSIVAELDSAPHQVYLIEFFSNSALNPAGRAEGERFIGQETVATDSNGHAQFSYQYNEIADGELANTDGITFITATATRKHCESAEPTCLYGSTSEFSQACRIDMSDPSDVDCTD